MTTNPPSAQKLRRNGSPSTSKSIGPLRATIPVSLMTQPIIHDMPEDENSQNNWSKTQTSSNATTSSSSNLPIGVAKPSSWRLRQMSPTPKVETFEAVLKNDDFQIIHRTPSLDIYLKGQWPRGTVNTGSNTLDKATQTPDEWVDMKRFSYRGLEASPKRDRKQKQRLLPTHQAQNPPLMPQYSSGSISPNRVAASTNTDQHYVSTVVTDDGKETSRAIPVPPPPTSQTSRARNSVEGFNTEIEKLVCRGHEITSSKVMEPTPDGHRAPIAELFKQSTCRSVDTQTPVNAYSTNSSSGTSSPCGSVSPSVWGVFDHHHSSRPPSSGTVEEISEYNSLSPDDFQGLSLGTSPRGRFLCREPPDGCEKVETLKVMEHPVNGPDASVYCPPKPNLKFVLQPSSSSAFCSLNKLTTSTIKSSSSSHLFHGNTGSHGSNIVDGSDRSNSVPPQWPVQHPTMQIPAGSGQVI